MTRTCCRHVTKLCLHFCCWWLGLLQFSLAMFLVFCQPFCFEAGFQIFRPESCWVYKGKWLSIVLYIYALTMELVFYAVSFLFQVEDMRLIIHNLGKFLSHRDVKVGFCLQLYLEVCLYATFCLRLPNLLYGPGTCAKCPSREQHWEG